MTIVDAHCHLWDPVRIRYRLLDGSGRLAPLVRPVLGAEFAAVARANGVGAAVIVEAASAGADPRTETAFLLGQAEGSAISTRIVAYAPVESPEIEAWLDALDPRVTGVRRTFESVPDGFVLSDAVVAGVQAVGRRGLPFDLVLFADRLGEAVELVRRLREVTFVLDHLGKPAITPAVPARWCDEIAAMASLPNVVAKVSGLITEANGDWDTDLRPYVQHAVACFGWQRLLFGSDWPICELAGGYERWLAFCKSIASAGNAEERAAFFAGNARRIYGLR